MSDAVDRGKALLARMERTDQVSFYGARVVIQELCDQSERLEAECARWFERYPHDRTGQ